ncbi:MAG TPA: tetraacyldisaccharide 4'-kinase [Acetobacteraceae bacterium]|nr:tetraacyldisaccharide 4'-kinase [Acetobacteraceae bacterium]
MKAPRFWQTDGFAAALLAPFAAVTAAVTARRVARPGWRAPVPVLCIGNATVGGTGKTPITLDIARRLRGRGVEVHLMTRGYGGSSQAAARVQAEMTAGDAGDEALLLAAAAPCWVGADRAASARAAIAAGAGALLMDDGLQNPTLAKDCSLLVIDGAIGFGNGRLLPAGPLREPIGAAAARCCAAVMVGEDRHGATEQLPPDLPVLRARLVPGRDMQMLRGERVMGFAGIGRPEKFFATLRDAGIIVVDQRGFPDHHAYRATEISGLRRQAAALGARLVTTEKDFVRLPAALRADITPLPADIAWEDESGLEALLRQVVA